MAATERTPLTRPTDSPTYVEYAGLLRTRRTKVRQFQCCICATFIAIFIMALVITVSYSINKADPLVSDSTNPEKLPLPPSLKAAESPPDPWIRRSLTSDEWNEGIKAGEAAIALRAEADALATPLPAPSPNSRHQYAVKTSLQAGKLALAGIGELAATRNIEESRARLGEPTSIGSYFKNDWAPEGSCKEFLKMECPPSKYRNFDGTCNHPKNLGSALMPFIRKLPPDYADGIEAPRIGKFGKTLPSAREISLKVHPPAPSSNPSFTVMLAVFGQFLDHDITATAISQGTNGSSLTCCPATTHKHPECFPVRVGIGDPVYDLAGRDCMEFVRSAPAPQCKIGPRQQLNQVTSFIDGSVIYGPDVGTAQSLREGQGGLLRMFKTPDNRTLLPQSTDPNDGCNRDAESVRGRYCFSSGDGRANENLHLTTMHLLWARQHNRIARALSAVNPTWDDEQIYQETRRIIGAQLQHIAYKEFVPTILGEKDTYLRKLKPLTSGFRPRNESADVNPAIANSFAAAAFRFAHTLLPGLMKVTDSQKSSSSYVELHRMLFNPYSLYSKGGVENSLTTAISNNIQKTSTHVTSQLTKHLFEDPLSNVTVPCGLDLVSLNIQRGRDHGIPGYTAWRQYCGLPKVESFADLQKELDTEVLSEISKLYDYVDDIDLYTGALAESDKSDGLVGPTFRCLLGDQFTRIQQGDRFWYETSGGPQSFTEGQLREIRKTTLAKLICECSDEINQIQPLVMRSVSPGNPMTSCQDIPDLDVTAWKETSSPVLQAAAVQVPATWLDFKKEINKTVLGIANFFSQTTPPTGSVDWPTFKEWINTSFTDIRSGVSALDEKPSKILDLTKFPPSKLNKKIEEGSKEMGELNYMHLAINRSLSSLDEYPHTAAAQPMMYHDWISFKNDIIKILVDAVVNATGTPTADQREELKNQIVTEIEKIKSEIAFKMTKKMISTNQFETAAAASDWPTFKDDLTKAITEAIDRIKDKAPPPGDLSWSTFGSEIKSQFAAVKNYIPILPSKTLMAKVPSAAAYWDNFRDSINKSINNAIGEIDGNMPAPGDPAWADFGAMMKNRFSGFKTNSNLQARDPSVDGSKTKDSALVAYWDRLRHSLNRSISDAVADIEARSPPPGDPAWATFGTKIMNDFSGFRNSFGGPKKSVKFSEGINDSAVAAFWDNFEASINTSINSAVAEGIGKRPGDPAWAAFAAKIMKDVDKYKDRFAVIRGPTGETTVKASAAGKDASVDWYTFKTDIVNSVADTVITIKKNMPPPGSPAWSAFRGQIMNGLTKIPSDVPTGSPVETSGKDPISSKNGGTFDWFALKNEINESLSKITQNKQILADVPTENFQWVNFDNKLNKNVEVIKSEIDTLRPKPEESQFTDLSQDWTDFQKNINISLVDTFDPIENKAPSPGDPGWVAFKNSIKDEFAALKNKINSMNYETALKTPLNTIKSCPSDEKAVYKVQETQNVPDFSSDLFSLQRGTNMTLVQLRKSIENMKLRVTAPVISTVDWVAFKQEIKDTVNHFLDTLNGTQADEWKDMKDFVTISFAELRKDVIALKNKPNGLQQQIEAGDEAEITLKRKKSKDSTNNGKTPANNYVPFDWDTLKDSVNLTVQSLLGDIRKINPAKDPSKTLRDSLVKARNKFANLQLSPSLTGQDKLPDDWAIFVNGVNKTLSGLMKKIAALKPVDNANPVTIENYGKEVDLFFDEIRDVLERKKTEFEATTSLGCLVSSFLGGATTIISACIIFIIF